VYPLQILKAEIVKPEDTTVHEHLGDMSYQKKVGGYFFQEIIAFLLPQEVAALTNIQAAGLPSVGSTRLVMVFSIKK
jgi:hypothetical protein